MELAVTLKASPCSNAIFSDPLETNQTHNQAKTISFDARIIIGDTTFVGEIIVALIDLEPCCINPITKTQLKTIESVKFGLN